MELDRGPFLLTSSVPPARVGEHLRRARLRAGLSRRELASRLGVGGRWVRRWENGTWRLPDPVLRRSLDVLGVSLEELVPPRHPMVYDRSRAVLAMGDRQVSVDPVGDGNLGVLQAFVALVGASRYGTPRPVSQLRYDDLDQLASLLDLDDPAMPAQLSGALGVTPARGSELHRRLLRHRRQAALAAAASPGRRPSAPDAATSPLAAPVWRSLALVPGERAGSADVDAPG